MYLLTLNQQKDNVYLYCLIKTLTLFLDERFILKTFLKHSNWVWLLNAPIINMNVLILPESQLNRLHIHIPLTIPVYPSALHNNIIEPLRCSHICALNVKLPPLSRELVSLFIDHRTVLRRGFPETTTIRRVCIRLYASQFSQLERFSSTSVVFIIGTIVGKCN